VKTTLILTNFVVKQLQETDRVCVSNSLARFPKQLSAEIQEMFLLNTCAENIHWGALSKISGKAEKACNKLPSAPRGASATSVLGSALGSVKIHRIPHMKSCHISALLISTFFPDFRNIGIIQTSSLFMKNSRQLLRYSPMKNS
jgi:hypothetical protein